MKTHPPEYYKNLRKVRENTAAHETKFQWLAGELGVTREMAPKEMALRSQEERNRLHELYESALAAGRVNIIEPDMSIPKEL